MNARTAEQPDQHATGYDDEQAGADELAPRLQQRQGAQYHETAEVTEQVQPAAVQPGRQQDAWQRLELPGDQPEAIKGVAIQAVDQLQHDHHRGDAEQQLQAR